MTDLVERYIHQVGRYLPASERQEIEAELRSQIHDQLEDRYGAAPSQAEVTAALTELGDPRTLAASYSSEQYLVGPELYPTMLKVLRRGGLMVPSIVVFFTVFEMLISGESGSLPGLLITAMFAVIQATLIFLAVVVAIFAILQKEGVKLKEHQAAFNPLQLPAVNDPASVDQFEVAFGMAFGMFISLILIYFLRVGGLTLRLDPVNPGDVIPAPAGWLLALIVTCFLQLILHVPVARRNRWTIPTLLTQTLLELFGVVCLYFAVLQPFFDRLPDSAAAGLPLLIAVSLAVMTLLAQLPKLVRMWQFRHNNTALLTAQTNQ